MTDSLLLDILFAVCALLLLPIGFSRGAQRELCVSAGVLAGSTLASSWARPWGDDLASLLNVSEETGRFVITVLFLTSATIVVGYAGAAALHFDRPELGSRLAGALLAAINGTLIVAFVLRSIESNLADSGTKRMLQQSKIAWTLLRQFGWVALGMSAIALVMIVTGLAGSRQESAGGAQVPGTAGSWQRRGSSPRSRRRRLGWGSDEGKLEPIAAEAIRANRFTETIPIAPVDSSRWSLDRAHGTPTGGREWLELATVAGPSGLTASTPTSSTIRGKGETCSACGELLRPDDAFCPHCGESRA